MGVCAYVPSNKIMDTYCSLIMKKLPPDVSLALANRLRTAAEMIDCGCNVQTELLEEWELLYGQPYDVLHDLQELSTDITRVWVNAHIASKAS